MIINTILSIINNILPKRKTILFNSFPDVSGNSLAVYEYILNNRPDIQEKYNLIWSVAFTSPEENQKILSERTKKTVT